MQRAIKLCVRRPKTVIAIWLLVIVALAASAPQVQHRLTQSTLDIPGTPSTKAMQLYRQRFGDSASVPILLQGPASSLDREGPQLVRALDAQPRVRVLSPWDKTLGPSPLRKSPNTALVFAVLDRSLSQSINHGAPEITNVVKQNISSPVKAHVTGMAVIGHAIRDATFKAGQNAERIATPILLLVLLLVFRSPIAAAIPALLGMSTVAAATGTLSILATFMPIDPIGVNLAEMMGLALGVDYSLLIVSRFREELAEADGADVRQAAATTAALTAGRTVMFAGVALFAGMLVALLLAPGSLLVSAAVSVIIVTLLAVIGALTAVPAGLSILGPAINRWPIGRTAPGTPRHRPRWLALPATVLRRPAPIAAAIFVGMMILAIPASAIKAGPPEVHQLPSDNPARKDFVAVQRAMGPGWAAPFEIVSVSPGDAPPISQRGRLNTMSRLQDQIARDPDVSTVVGPGDVANQTTQQVAQASHDYATAGSKIARGKQQTNDLINGLGQAGNGAAQLRQGLAQATAGLSRLDQGSTSASQGAAQLAQGLAAAANGAQRLGSGLTAAEGGANQLANASGRAARGADRLASTLEAIRSAAQGAAPLANSLTQQLGAGAQDLSAIRGPAAAARQQLQSSQGALSALPPQLRSLPPVQSALSGIQGALNNTSAIDSGLGALQGQTQRALSAAHALAGQTTGVLDRVTAGAQRLSAGIDMLHQKTRQLANGLTQLASGQNRLQNGLGRLSQGADALQNGIQQLGAGADRLKNGLGRGYQQSAPLVSGLLQMQQGVAQFRSGELNPDAAKYYRAHSETPHVFDSGYFVLAVIQGARPVRRRDANFVLNVANGGSAARMLVVPRSAPTSKGDSQLDNRLKGDAGAIGHDTATQTMVGGTAAQLADYARVTSQRLLVLVLALAAVTYLVLVPVFRSLLMPAIAVALNLLTVGASFGILSMLFEGAHPPLGGPGYLDAIAVTAMYSVIFALSMDYQVFLITRMREGYVQTGDPRQAIAHGLGRTASIVTSAALIMLAVFISFAFSSVINIRQFGVGLAIAVALDATVVRLVLLPALIRLGGRASWWLPRPLQRVMPDLAV